MTNYFSGQAEHEVEIDLDEVLDIEEDLERKVFIKVFIIDDTITRFIINEMKCYLCINYRKFSWIPIHHRKLST